jgi:hypothetical protein
MPGADIVDVSVTGTLLALEEPVGVVTGERLCVSFSGADGALHLIGRVVRCARASDFRSYVAVVFEVDGRPERERWTTMIGQLDG